MTQQASATNLPGGVPLIIISGMSGAGKISAMRTLEDMGCFCADNLPPSIIPTFFHLCRQGGIADLGVAIVSDVRSGAPFEDFREAMQALKRGGVDYELIFLDCGTESLIRRFKEVRRAPPLMTAGQTMEQAIEEERRRLSPIRDIATHIIDTGNLTLQDFRSRLVSDLGRSDAAESMTIHVMSFGFKYGLPKELDYAFDVRFLPNPFYDLAMKHRTGKDEDVYAFVMKSEVADRFFGHACDMLESTLDAFIGKGKNSIIVGVGCTGGRHRSVAVAIRLHRYFAEKGIHCILSHRDVEKPQQ